MIEFFDEATRSVVQWQARTLFENRKHSRTKANSPQTNGICERFENVQQTGSNKKNINIKHGMDEKTSNKTSGLVDYKELIYYRPSEVANWQRRSL
ncbi:hypothetical protein [Candidatus Mesenet endosymbiont of Agriotes lineatus]|uniref:hypothetical protein n=1 Tax=Candidatus Mesenet endosymbiont of Agriotes lineatus TaxID=3077948 RepID=UPI0030D30359